MAHCAQVVSIGKKSRQWCKPKHGTKQYLKYLHKRRLRRMSKDLSIPNAAIQYNRYV